MKLADDGHCFACGAKNPEGLKLLFYADGGKIAARFIPEKKHQGYMDIVHGGIICTLLDEAMAKAAIQSGIEPVTAEIKVRFKEPLMVGEEVLIEAGIESINGKFIETSASLTRLKDKRIIAKASAKLISNE